MLALTGAGIVHWLRLEIDGAILGDSNLWLEIAVDGEASPSIACPARMWFAPLAGGVPHRSFLAVECDGLVNRLAIPYRQGLTISLRNRGDLPLTDVGVTASFEPIAVDGASPFLSRGRLRTCFAGADPERRSVHLAGPGRLVGLIVDGRLPDGTFLNSLTIDGKPQTAWDRVSLENFLEIITPPARGGKGERHYGPLSGRDGPLAWRYFILTPVEFSRSLAVDFCHPAEMDRHLLYYDFSGKASARPPIGPQCLTRPVSKRRGPGRT